MGDRQFTGPWYSGECSAEFWARVNAIPDGRGYGLAVALQNVEADILHLLECEEEGTLPERAERLDDLERDVAMLNPGGAVAARLRAEEADRG